MYKLFSFAVAALVALPAAAQTPYPVWVDRIGSTGCHYIFSNGSEYTGLCPDDIPVVTCQCEHLGSPYDDLCETQPQGNLFRYAYTPVGRATVLYSDPLSAFGRFVCPRNTPPNSVNCSARVTVTNTFSGVTKTAQCYSN
jgi:hypothetical protein